MSFWYLQFFQKMNEKIKYLKLICFRSFFGRIWRHQKDISKLNDLYQIWIYANITKCSLDLAIKQLLVVAQPLRLEDFSILFIVLFGLALIEFGKIFSKSVSNGRPFIRFPANRTDSNTIITFWTYEMAFNALVNWSPI